MLINSHLTPTYRDWYQDIKSWTLFTPVSTPGGVTPGGVSSIALWVTPCNVEVGKAGSTALWCNVGGTALWAAPCNVEVGKAGSTALWCNVGGTALWAAPCNVEVGKAGKALSLLHSYQATKLAELWTDHLTGSWRVSEAHRTMDLMVLCKCFNGYGRAHDYIPEEDWQRIKYHQSKELFCFSLSKKVNVHCLNIIIMLNKSYSHT